VAATKKKPPEDILAEELEEHNVLAERQYRFSHSRRWKFDFAWPSIMLAVEVEGGVYSGGRHVTGTGYTADCEKYNAAALRGWTVLRYTPAMLKKGAVNDIYEEIMKREYDNFMKSEYDNA
jgi:very-short-patch-repair endonuclease